MNAIVVGTDGSPGAEAAVQKVIELGRGTGATIHLVCAYPAPSALERIGMTARQEPTDLRGVAYDVLARDERRFSRGGLRRREARARRRSRPRDHRRGRRAGGEPDRRRRARDHRAAALHARERVEQAVPPRADEPADRARGVTGRRHATRRDPPHHRDHRRRAGQRRVLRRRARAADGQEDRQPGRPDRLPPLLRRRGRLARRRPDVLRVPRRAPRRRRRGDGPPHRLARRVGGGARLLGAAARRSTASPRSAPTAAGCASRTPRGSPTSSSSRPWPTRR